jgi:hypothetical protein
MRLPISLQTLRMPTVLVEGSYHFIFFSSDWGEPPHIHVKHDRKIAKYWLEPVVLEKNRGYKIYELNRIRHLIENNQQLLLEAWNDYFNP